MKKLGNTLALLAVVAAALYSVLEPPDASAAHVVRLGAVVQNEAKRVALADLLAQPHRFTGDAVVIDGVVVSVCRFAGCWMKIAASREQEGIRVTFDGFSVPRNARGCKARLVGRASVKDGTVSFRATGVELLK